ncbi:hypothetical protein TCAL_04717 [Tigriopus californicus]|uniref:DUF962 domain-containing protein n=1 Tax=Tigriopus californicus TaxID=6832 RepID=A0A553PRT3_TIGCA|nr:uncharacterized protein LOC131892415 [Tigriopus californicus]TRY80397.1 hypothetical protein TCAL_04717 [Tigriopus californicus]|eukprot:TCALIF_04717-PA protein Name:"Similar to SPAC16E8.02 Uncharacterized endoplasmic reticulum membrane protein C16E8.02 (Schizosaccharomyces pombe (strain 972 / ATCC 24843))" AED:0.01 eAED:0.01 QI:151/1/1/1/1/1/4/41/205
MGFDKDSFDLEKQFTFYASYHANRVNVAIHLVCVWPILATAMLLLQLSSYCFLTHLPMPHALQNLPFGLQAPLNLALVMAIIYIVSYFAMEPIAGGLGALMVAGLYFGTWKMVSEDWYVGGYPIWQAAWVIFFLAWTFQFIGHGVFEGRAPALLDSLDQALITGGLFVLLEIFFFFGYRQDFYHKMMDQVRTNIEEFRESNKKGQ